MGLLVRGEEWSCPLLTMVLGRDEGTVAFGRPNEQVVGWRVGHAGIAALFSQGVPRATTVLANISSLRAQATSAVLWDLSVLRRA